MGTENTLHLYRNSSLDGEALPLDILLSAGLMQKSFSAVAANGLAIPSTPELLIIYADDTEGCFLQLGGAAAVPADGVFVSGLHYIPPACMKVLDANGAAVFGVISATGNAGAIIVEFAHTYKDARKRQQFNRT